MISISIMNSDDIAEVLKIEKECFATPWSENAFNMELKNKLAKYVVARVDGEIIGYGGLWMIIDEGHITNIAVKEEFRGSGAGSAILKHLIDTCKENGISSMTLEVRRGNEPAKALYKKYGFLEAGIRPKYYADDNEDALIMWLTF